MLSLPHTPFPLQCRHSASTPYGSFPYLTYPASCRRCKRRRSHHRLSFVLPPLTSSLVRPCPFLTTRPSTTPLHCCRSCHDPDPSSPHHSYPMRPFHIRSNVVLSHRVRSPPLQPFPRGRARAIPALSLPIKKQRRLSIHRRPRNFASRRFLCGQSINAYTSRHLSTRGHRCQSC